MIFAIFLFCGCSKKGPAGLGRSVNYAGMVIDTRSANCIIEFDDFDKSTRLRVIGLKDEVLFVFTHERLMSLTTGKPFLEVRAALVKNNKNQSFLHLSFIFDSKLMTPAYSGIPVSAPIKLRLINGKSITLSNTHHDRGRTDKSGGTLTHDALFPLTQKHLKQLRKYELDKIGISWAETHEEYSVYNIDLLKRQTNCLKKFRF